MARVSYYGYDNMSSNLIHVTLIIITIPGLT